MGISRVGSSMVVPGMSSGRVPRRLGGRDDLVDVVFANAERRPHIGRHDSVCGSPGTSSMDAAAFFLGGRLREPAAAFSPGQFQRAVGRTDRGDDKQQDEHSAVYRATLESRKRIDGSLPFLEAGSGVSLSLGQRLD